MRPEFHRNIEVTGLISDISFFYRPGSVEVTAGLALPSKNDIAKVQQALDSYNKSGMIGNIPWTASYWGPVGKSPEAE